MSLNTNITNLQEILNKVNTLPSAENLEDELNSQSTLIAEQNAKIAELAEALANKQASVKKYDTCTIGITSIGGKLLGYCATCFDGENVVYKYNFSSNNLGNITITDVICGSVFSVIQEATKGEIITTDGLAVIHSISDKGSMFIAPATPGVSAMIQISSSSSGGGGGPIHGGGDN